MIPCSSPLRAHQSHILFDPSFRMLVLIALNHRRKSTYSDLQWGTTLKGEAEKMSYLSRLGNSKKSMQSRFYPCCLVPFRSVGELQGMQKSCAPHGTYPARLLGCRGCISYCPIITSGSHPRPCKPLLLPLIAFSTTTCQYGRHIYSP